MTGIWSIEYISFSGRTKSFNGKKFAFFHFSSVAICDDWNTLTSMNSIWGNRMTTKILNCLHCMSFISDGNLVRFHHFLNCLSDISKSHIDTSLFNSFVSSLLNSIKKRVKLRIESNRKRTIDNLAINLSSEIYFHNIIIV